MGTSSLHDPDYKYVCEALRRLREEAGLTQRDLAKLLGTHHTYVHKSESGDRKIDLVEWTKWCRQCGVDESEQFNAIASKIRGKRRRIRERFDD